MVPGLISTTVDGRPAGGTAGLIIALLFGHRRRIELVVVPVPEKMSRTRTAL
jgi:MYXO-CTERM domain-containing protein